MITIQKLSHTQRFHNSMLELRRNGEELVAANDAVFAAKREFIMQGMVSIISEYEERYDRAFKARSLAAMKALAVEMRGRLAVELSAKYKFASGNESIVTLIS